MYPSLSLGLILLASSPFAACLSPTDIPRDTPISTLISSANEHLARGQFNDALTYFDVAISQDPKNYLTIFKRGATFLSLGKTAQAKQDFDRVLSIKPDFEGALLQRAKIRRKNCDWDGARRDYVAASKAGKAGEEAQELLDLDEAATAAQSAATAAENGDWETCVQQAGVAIMTASTCLELRKLRARCRFERGEVLEGVSDLGHVLQIDPQGPLEPHLQISAMFFYSLAETERGLAQIRKCLHSDPDSKACSRLFRREKNIDKQLGKIRALIEKRQFAGAAKHLVKTSDEDLGLIQEVKDDVKELRSQGYMYKKAPDTLVGVVVELACEAYTEMNNQRKATPHCEEVLEHNPHSLPALLARAQSLLDSEDFDAAISTLNTANEHHPSSDKIQTLLRKAHVLLKRSKTKDYYKILGLPRDADARQIKSAYRRLVKQHHPDKAVKRPKAGDDGQRAPRQSPEDLKKQAEKKMAAINEAYEVLSNPELRARFDNGDDPNSHENQGSPFQGQPFFFQQGAGAGHGHQQQFFFRNGPGGGGGGGGGGGSGGQFKFQFGGGAGGGGFPFG